MLILFVGVGNVLFWGVEVGYHSARDAALDNGAVCFEIALTCGVCVLSAGCQPCSRKK